MSPTRRGRPAPADLDALIAQLDAEELRAILRTAADRHDDVATALRLAANRSAGDLGPLRAEIDRGLRTRRFLDYRESSGWAIDARPIVAEIRDAVASSPSAELVALIQRSVGHVVKVILHADDSNGTIGDLARELLSVHAEACDALVADPVKLARWMVRFRFDDQDFFEVDPVRYAAALGDVGLAAYRHEVEGRVAGGDRSFAARYAEERLAVLDGDTAAVVRLLGGDLQSPRQFVLVAQAMVELGRDADVLAWATRGIAETSGWQVGKLYDLAADVHARTGDDHAILELRRAQHARMPSVTTYGLLRAQAETVGAWESERAVARSVLAAHDLGASVDVLLADGEPEAAWQVTVDNPHLDLGADRWLRLAGSREVAGPADALTVYLRLTDLQLETSDRSAYLQAAAILERARRAAAAAGRQESFVDHVAGIRDRYRRRPTLIAILDKAGLP